MELSPLRSLKHRAPLSVIFLLAMAARTAWLPWRAPFSPDPSTTMWMALDAVRRRGLPDHGLVSSLHVFQPPGLVWAVMPFSFLGGGRPVVIMVGFAVLNAGALTATARLIWRRWGGWPCAVFTAFAFAGPDAYTSAMIWHPSLFIAATCLLFIAAVRVADGSRWWAAVLVAVPGTYALVHYSGLALYAPGAVLLAPSYRHWRRFLLPVEVGVIWTIVAWTPFLLFEQDRRWIDLRSISGASAGVHGLGFSAGFGLFGPLPITPVLLATAAVAALTVLVRRQRDPLLLTALGMFLAGVVYQEATGTAYRTDVFMVWLLPMVVMAAWVVSHLTKAKATAIPIVAGIVALNLAGLALCVDHMPAGEDLAHASRLAKPGAALPFDDLYQLNAIYLPCDPPYSWSTDPWYLQEIRLPGAGRIAARAAGAFALRHPCPRLDRPPTH